MLFRSVLERAGVSLSESHVSRAPDAAATLRTVTRGDADAAIVYETDVRAAGEAARLVALPSDENVTARYGIAALTAATDPALVRRFIATVVGPAGRAALRDRGFGTP